MRKVIIKLEDELRVLLKLYGCLCPLAYYNIFLIREIERSGTTRAANGEAVVPIVVVGRVDVVGAAKVEVVGVAGARVRGRRPVIAVAAGVVEQVGILVDDAAHQKWRKDVTAGLLYWLTMIQRRRLCMLLP